MEGAEETPSTSTEKRNSISNLMPRVARYLSHIRFLMIRVARHMKCFLLLFIYCENTCEYNAFSEDLKILTFQGLGGGLCPLYCLLGWVFQLLCFHFYAASPELLTAIYYSFASKPTWSSNVKPVSVVQTDLDKVLPMGQRGKIGVISVYLIASSPIFPLTSPPVLFPVSKFWVSQHFCLRYPRQRSKSNFEYIQPLLQSILFCSFHCVCFFTVV